MYESYINKIEDIGKLRNLKPGTIRTYQNNVRDFLKFINKHPDELTCEDARDFLLHLKNKGDKASTLNNKNGALVFFYKRVLGKLWDDNLVPRAINDYAIPSQDCFFVYTAIDCSLKNVTLLASSHLFRTSYHINCTK